MGRDAYSPSGEHSLKDLMSLVSGKLDEGDASSSRAATATWLRVNGDVERRHTVATFLAAEDGRKVLVVYIDSSAMMQDFSTNKLIYLDRLAHGGLPLDDIRFRLSRYGGRKPKADDAHAEQGAEDAETPYDVLPPVPEEVRAQVAEEVAGLPPRLRDAVSEALITSYRRSLDNHTNFG
ncbi:MAG: DUF721 domain-containing protein [Atopobiaceae bacterium]|jgi:hypothetical protein|nr:DUF721 domain-containing protein [Atopobiaceae bacterium]MCH4119911.1 DUF721 domain-containing protein [Atopobiaceae bacterium]MCI1318993.1 DUF721 domain-containing protein [Atopobiaceae bacterium]MCI1389192.1 DUF721 domain-containing protein [Atopobiaceae bacterium]MCI1432797.1 DUF721 domain-containing protein [Atopobiaceae bacterium]